MFRSSKDLKFLMDEVKSVKSLIKSIDVNLKQLSNKIDVQGEENKRRFYELEGNMARNLSKMDETVRKSANSINVIVRFMAGSQNMNVIELREILIAAGALTEHVRSTSDIYLRDIPTEILNMDSSSSSSSRSHTREIIETVDSIPSRNLNTENSSFDPINTDIPSTSTTNSTIPSISLIQNTMDQDVHSLTVNSPNISDIPNNANISNPINTNIPSTSATNLTRPQTSLVKNTIYHDQSSLTISSPNISDIPNNVNISDPINTNIPSTSATNLTKPQTSSVKNTMYHDQSSLTISSPNISDIPKNVNISDPINTNIPSTSATNSTMSQTLSVLNTLQEQQISSNISNLSTLYTRCENANNCTTVPNVMLFIDNTNREKELQEREALRKKYRNKYKYLDKYKNISEKNSTPGENNNIKNPHLTDSSFKNVNEPHPTRSKVKNVNNLRPSNAKLNDESNSTQTFLNSLKDIHPYRDAIYNGIEQVEIIVNGNDRDNSKPVTVFQPRVLIDLIDANSAVIKQRLAKADSKSCQNNSSKISQETISTDKSNSNNVAINKIIKNDTQKSETLVNTKNKRKGVMKNGQCAPPKKRASFRKQSNIK